MKEKDFVFKIKKKTLLIAIAVLVVIVLGVKFLPGNIANTNPTGKVISNTVDIIILNDKRCKECDVSRTITQLKSSFPDFVVSEIDYMDEEGKKIYGESDLTVLPVILFKDNVKDDANYAQVENYLEQKGDFLLLRIGANFDPTKEICDNGIDDTGNNLVDCEDNDCKGSMQCREEEENHIQVFIMSDCPYGRKAGEALKGVVDNFKGLIDYEVHYIASEQGDGFRSLHGQYEVDENIIQLCVKEHNPDLSLDYLYCRSTKGIVKRDSTGKITEYIDWKECGNEVGVNIETVQSCFDGNEGKGLLREDIKIAQELGVIASPTWFANNRYKFSGIDAERVKNSFCKYNEGLEGCDNTLGSSSPSTDAQC